ncbi:hypothetical protein [Candidatus Cryosericum septentrionale]|jgi:hypothetical protein|uniref:Uncharacterized protein n=1 Tax=Candidatus Cryosericum septentrionale TaxID=2290913 RepID=A0A398DTI0_9BACT|nr:hypothetical protein [Candidatus Cryosericum septentrionale]RIE17399.1 hypothetical protein SMC1_01920 [Candidatus Cryosericum septentrionale]
MSNVDRAPRPLIMGPPKRRFLRYAVFGATTVGKQYACPTTPNSDQKGLMAAVGQIRVSKEIVTMANTGREVSSQDESGMKHSSRDESVIQYLEFNRPVSYSLAETYLPRLCDAFLVWECGMREGNQFALWPLVGRVRDTIDTTNMFPTAFHDWSLGADLWWLDLFRQLTPSPYPSQVDLRWKSMLQFEEATINSRRFTAAANYLAKSLSDFIVELDEWQAGYLLQPVTEPSNAPACSAHLNAYKCIEELWGGEQLPDERDKARVVRKFDAMYHVDLTKSWSVLVSRREKYADVPLVDVIYRVLDKRNKISGHGGASRDPKNRKFALIDVLDTQLLARQLLIDCAIAK